jgi:hypothetical protein
MKSKTKMLKKSKILPKNGRCLLIVGVTSQKSKFPPRKNGRH